MVTEKLACLLEVFLHSMQPRASEEEVEVKAETGGSTTAAGAGPEESGTLCCNV